MLINRISRSQQSKEWIILSLLKLMETQTYSTISITDIARKAGLARQTFYRNYSDKDEILYDFLHHHFVQFRYQLSHSDIFNEGMFVALFRGWQEHIPSSLMMNIVNHDRKIRQIIFRSLDSFIHELCKDSPAFENKLTQAGSRYALRSLSSTIHVLLIEWTLHDFAQTSEEMGHLAFQLTDSMRKYLL